MAKVYKGTGTKVAKLVGKTAPMDAAAEKVQAKAEANAATRRDTGAYSGSFKTTSVPGKKGVTDRMVYNSHPAAVAIEFGHFTGEEGGSWVPGQFNLIRAAK